MIFTLGASTVSSFLTGGCGEFTLSGVLSAGGNKLYQQLEN